MSSLRAPAAQRRAAEPAQRTRVLRRETGLQNALDWRDGTPLYYPDVADVC